MTPKTNWLLFGIFMTFSFHVHAQIDSTHKKKQIPTRQKLIPNSTKLELVYKEALVTQYNSNGGSRSYNVFQPFVRVNDAKPVEIGKHAEFLRNFFSKCSEADEQIDLMNQQMRRARLDFYGGFGVGAVIAFSGLPAAANSNGSGATTFWTHFGVGAAVMVAGAYLAHMHAQRADDHLRLSVDIYNSRCFKPLPADTAHKLAAATPARERPVYPSERKLYHDTTQFRLIRNDPSHSGLFGLTVVPLIANVSSLNINFNGGLGFFYTYESKFGISATYQRAYWDYRGHDLDEIMGSDAESAGAPASYSKSTRLEILAKGSLISWEKEGYYHLHLGHTRIGGQPAEVVGRTKGTIVQAITTRAGYMIENQAVQSNSAGIEYKNATPEYDYHFGGQVYPLDVTNLSTSATTVKAGIITAGLGFSTFRDIKIELLDDTYTGRREEKSQTDLFVDLLYAHSMTVQDMIYYHALEPRTGEYQHLPQRLDLSQTPVRKLGARLGATTVSMYSPHFGIKTMIELGIRPGPQTLDKQEGFYASIGFGIIFGGRISQQ